MLIAVFCKVTAAQENIHVRAITLDEYNKAKLYSVKDLDRDTYVKFENAYILDRYEMRKPYFIMGDDGKKKRIDLYKLIAKDSLQELGTVIFYVLKNKYVVSPDGKPLGGLPSKRDASDFEEGEGQKAVFSTTSLIVALISFIVLILIS